MSSVVVAELPGPTSPMAVFGRRALDVSAMPRRGRFANLPLSAAAGRGLPGTPRLGAATGANCGDFGKAAATVANCRPTYLLAKDPTPNERSRAKKASCTRPEALEAVCNRKL